MNGTVRQTTYSPLRKKINCAADFPLRKKMNCAADPLSPKEDKLRSRFSLSE